MDSKQVQLHQVYFSLDPIMLPVQKPLFYYFPSQQSKNMFSRIISQAIVRPINSSFYLKQNFFYSGKKSNQLPSPIVEQRQQSQRRSAYLNMALTCFVFAACFAGIPLYRIFCQHIGLTGDSNKKQYTFSQSRINNLKKFKVSFNGYCDPDINWSFQPVERELVVNAGETAIVFYRLYNREEKPIVGFATYNIFPEDCNLYFSKIQCFCFNQQLINPKEELLLPIFFYLQPEINEDEMVKRVEEIRMTYTFTKSAKQDLARFAANEQKRIQDNKKKLNQIRAKKMNMSIDEYIAHLESQKLKEQAEQAAAKTQKEKQSKQAALIESRLRENFQQDMIKAQIISQSIQNDIFQVDIRSKSIS